MATGSPRRTSRWNNALKRYNYRKRTNCKMNAVQLPWAGSDGISGEKGWDMEQRPSTIGPPPSARHVGDPVKEFQRRRDPLLGGFCPGHEEATKDDRGKIALGSLPIPDPEGAQKTPQHEPKWASLSDK